MVTTSHATGLEKTLFVYVCFGKILKSIRTGMGRKDGNLGY